MTPGSIIDADQSVYTSLKRFFGPFFICCIMKDQTTVCMNLIHDKSGIT